MHYRLFLITLIIALLTGGSGLPPTSHAQGPDRPAPSAHFGVDGLNPAYLTAIAPLGDGYSGMNGLSWGEVEPQPGRIVLPHGADEALSLLAQTGRNLQINLRLENEWAIEVDPSTTITDPGSGQQHNGMLRINPAYHDNWQMVVRTVVERTDALALQIGSEAANEWTSADGFIEALCLAYDAAKAANPDVIVMTAGFNPGDYFLQDPATQETYRQSGFDHKLRFMTQVLTEGAACFDVLSFHPSRAPEAIPPTVAWFRETMQNAGVDRPIWIDDMYSGPWLIGPGASDADRQWLADVEAGDADAIAAFEAAQSTIIVQKCVLAFASGVDRVFVSSDIDWTWYHVIPWRHAGLLGQDSTPKPAFYTYGLLIDRLDAFEGIDPLAPGVYHFTFPQGPPLIVAWAVEDAPPVDFGAVLGTDTVQVTAIITQSGITTPEVTLLPAGEVQPGPEPVLLQAAP